MSASITENLSRRLVANQGMSQVHRDISDERYKDLRRPRKVRFFVNGDRYFKGKKLYITPHRYYNFNDLLNDLTGKLPSSLNLPYGVRQIFTPVGGRRVSDIEDLQDGETYVCAGFEGFKIIKYGRTELEPWSVGKSVRLGQGPDPNEANSEAGYRYRGYASNAFHPGRYFRTNGPHMPMNIVQTNRRWPNTFGTAAHRQSIGLLAASGQADAIPIKPKVVTIVRNGPQPRNSVKILLNRRSVQSYEQLVADISEAFGPKWKANRVQRLFTTHGKEVKGVGDFFREDDCFIAIGNERLSENDVADIIEELYPDSAYAKTLLKDWEKQRRREARHRASMDVAGEGDKDSGFIDIDGDHQDSELLSSQRFQKVHRSRRAGPMETVSENDVAMEADTGSPQGYYTLSKMERERKQAANEERDKARRVKHRLAEQENKALEEERIRRGLPPLNHLKPLDDIRRKDPKEKEEARKKKAEEALKKIEEEREAERIKKMKEEREAAERAARERMAAAEKAEKTRQEQEKREHEKAESEMTVQEKVDGEKIVVDKEKLDKQDKESALSETKVSEKPVETTNLTENKASHDDREKERLKESKKRKKDKQDISGDKATGRKPKAKVVRRSKAERQVSSDSFVTELYELGDTLGDGNFAIVRFSRLKSSAQEFAMKVIDKPKLRGKEHMVENEIDIMKDCSHPNIVKLYEEYETKDKIYLVMELVKGGDLFDAISHSVKFGEVDSALMVKDLCSALYYLHSRSIVHRDLKPENLLVHRNKDGTITLKLADFGLAMEVKEPIFTVCGTPTYVAPEILTEIGYGLEVDMWAVGVITYILLCGFPPFRSPDRNQNELFEYIKAGHYEFISPYWDSVSKNAKDLISRLLVVDKSQRYNAIDVLSHPWVVCSGNTHQPLPGIANITAYCREIRRDYEEQAKHNYDAYQRLKEKKRLQKEE